ncbi:MAG: hypothetical protein K6G30_01690 [Acetatifactor sp.]|nr:hypothetical protein [Acetatifactor sp.]
MIAHDWANAFCDRDGRTIVELSTENAQKALIKEQLLDIEEDPGNGQVDLKVSFKEDGVDRVITMILADAERSIWIPQDYGTVKLVKSPDL